MADRAIGKQSVSVVLEQQHPGREVAELLVISGFPRECLAAGLQDHLQAQRAAIEVKAVNGCTVRPREGEDACTRELRILCAAKKSSAVLSLPAREFKVQQVLERFPDPLRLASRHIGERTRPTQ